MNTEFESITEENIREVLEYNGFEFIGTEKLVYGISIFRCLGHGIYRFDYGQFMIKHNFIKVMDFMQEFIDLKPLPKKPAFDAKKYLIENGFKSGEEFTNHVNNLNYYPYYYSDTIEIYVNFELCEFYFSYKYPKRLNQENLGKVIAAAKILEELK